MLPIADGSDMGGSLRNPGNFNNVVGLRPSAGLVPRWPSGSPWLPLSVKGPLARTVDDVALILRAMAGYDPRDQLSYETAPGTFETPLEADVAGRRVAGRPISAGCRSIPPSGGSSTVRGRRWSRSACTSRRRCRT
jgi:amidase